jgi:peptide/nickel transport system substrate-binding protein
MNAARHAGVRGDALASAARAGAVARVRGVRLAQGAAMAVLALLAWLSPALTARAEEPPALKADVESGKLPPLDKRLPQTPLVMTADRADWTPGRYGGDLRMLMAKDRDIRMMVVYGYSRLVGYNEKLELVPDILERIDNVGSRVFTLHLRPGHRWSDGHPFTAEDFRYYWEDVANNPELTRFGLPQVLRVRDVGPKFEVLSPTTVRFTWAEPNPQFLPALAGPSPLFIYRPGHYLRQFHPRYIGLEKADEQARAAGLRNWAGLHQKKDEQYRFDNPELPTLEPWYNTTPLPSTRFVLVRNPYFHRVDPLGRQLPYIDRVIVNIADDKLIPAKVGAGDIDLQARYLRFDNYTFLKQNERRNQYRVILWEKAIGAQIALYPNLNVQDSAWRALMRDARFRRALSLAINRHEINEVVYFGLAKESANTVLQRSSLYRPQFGDAWIKYDMKAANALLDEIGLTRRDAAGLRLLPDGRPMELIIDTSGESTEETDVLELIRDSWRKIGIAMFSRPSQREVFRKRAYAGTSMMTIWSGLDNGIPTPEMSPKELAPTAHDQLQWPAWGQYYDSMRKIGEPPALPEAQELIRLYDAWRHSSSTEEREQQWLRMLEIHAQQCFTIGVVARALQPIVVRNGLRNVPAEGIYSWDPGAYFGMYRMDTFWFDTNGSR